MNGVTEPCPWCRGATIKTRHLGQWAGVDMYAALCQTEGCGATGPTRDTEPAALAAVAPAIEAAALERAAVVAEQLPSPDFIYDWPDAIAAAIRALKETRP